LELPTLKGLTDEYLLLVLTLVVSILLAVMVRVPPRSRTAGLLSVIGDATALVSIGLVLVSFLSPIARMMTGGSLFFETDASVGLQYLFSAALLGVVSVVPLRWSPRLSPRWEDVLTAGDVLLVGRLTFAVWGLIAAGLGVALLR
jgi:hypothetical protein